MSPIPSSRLWSSEQIRSITGWTDILKRWHDTLHVPHYVQEVMNNLRAASDPNSNYNPPLADFLRFLGYEQNAYKWFVYEIVAVSWMWGNKRLDYLREILPRLDSLDTLFPFFPGSPATHTIRSFLESQLTPAEYESLGLRQRWSNPVTNTNTNSVVTHPVVSIRCLRKEPHDREKYDDVLFIRKVAEGKYRLTYKDKQSKTSCVTEYSSDRDVLNHVRLMLNLLKEDDDPFSSVQVCFPNYPTCLFELSTLNSSKRDLIYDCLESTMNSWPTA